MSQQVKSFFSGSIVTTLIIAGVLGAFKMAVDSQLQKLEKTAEIAEGSQLQLMRVVTSLDGAVKSIDKVNDALSVYTKYHAQNLVHITGALVEHRKELDKLDSKCHDIQDECDMHNGTKHDQ